MFSYHVNVISGDPDRCADPHDCKWGYPFEVHATSSKPVNKYSVGEEEREVLHKMMTEFVEFYKRINKPLEVEVLPVPAKRKKKNKGGRR